MYIYAIMYIARELAYNKSEENSIPQVNVASYLKVRFDTYSSLNECQFFITTIITIRSDKMIEMSLRTFIIKVLFFIVY